VLAFGCVYSPNGTDRDPSPSRPASGVCECMLWHSPREQGGQPGKDPHALEPRDAARPLDRIAARSSYHGPARADSSIVVRHLSSYGLAPAIALCEKSSVVVRHEPEMLFASSARTDRIGLSLSALGGLHESRIRGRHSDVVFSSLLNPVLPKGRAVRALVCSISSELRLLDSQPPVASERCKTSGGTVPLHEVAPSLEKSDDGRSYSERSDGACARFHGRPGSLGRRPEGSG